MGVAPSQYVLRKYEEAHRSILFNGNAEPDRFDRILLRIARTAPFLARVADCYAVIFAARSVLRRKLVLLLAILENCAPSYAVLEGPEQRAALVMVGQAIERSVAWMVTFLLALLTILPLHAVVRIFDCSYSEKRVGRSVHRRVSHSTSLPARLEE